MQKLILSLFILLVSVSASFGQATETKEMIAKKATAALVDEYNLDAKQAEKMYVIQERKQRNLASIESFKDSNPDLYRTKKKSIFDSTKATTKRILNKEQTAIFMAKQKEQRMIRARKISEMKDQGMTKKEINDALIDSIN